MSGGVGRGKEWGLLFLVCSLDCFTFVKCEQKLLHFSIRSFTHNNVKYCSSAFTMYFCYILVISALEMAFLTGTGHIS